MKKICVIDSGYRADDKNIKSDQIERAITVKQVNNEFLVSEGAEDNIGHGTAILSIIQQGTPYDNVYIVLKIFDNELSCDEELLIFALEYVCKNIECDLVNLSLGITCSKNKKQLLKICRKIYEKGIIIVSAFDNDGAVSYPAAFPYVIGVDSNAVCKSRNDIAFVENSIVNIFAFGRMQRISQFYTKYMYVSGASVACAHITRILSSTDAKTFSEAISKLYSCAKYVFYKNIKQPTSDIPTPLIQNIKKAILFPYNKEMHSVVKFDNMLSFAIHGVYDTTKSGLVGRKIYSYDGEREYVINNWQNIMWEQDFDTVILGHLGEYSKLINEDLLYKVLTFSKQFNKKVYCFDTAPTFSQEFKSVPIDWPHKEFLQDKFGKLYEIDCPILGIFGTGSKQGKYTLQLILRKLFLQNGYKVGQIGSEPSSLLFGMDDMFHFGYNEKFELNDIEFIEALNDSLNKIQEKDVDIIIVGCQSGTIPYSLVNMKYATCKQISFLTGVNPDRVVLCINLFDDLDYIGRTISFIESLGACKVIAAVLFPMTFSGDYAMIGTPSKHESLENICLKKNEIMQTYNIPCFELGIEEEMQDLFMVIINSFM